MDGLSDWMIDGNGDGYPDDGRVRFVVDIDRAGREFWAALLDLAARIGLETHALPLPLAVVDNSAVPAGVDLVRLSDPGDIPSLSTDQFLPLESTPVTSAPASGCLTRLFTFDGMLEDRDDDQLPDASRITFDLPESLPAMLGVALANLAARIGLESGGVTFPLVRAGDTPFVVRPGDGPACLRADAGGWRAEGDADELAALIERVAATWPHISAPETDGASSALATLRRWLAGDGPEPHEPGEVVFEREWTAIWEGDALVEHISGVLADLTPESDAGAIYPDVHDPIFLFACEPAEQRQQIAAKVREVVAASAFPGLEITVLSSFKSGLSWLREVVIPELVALPVRRVRVVASAYENEEIETLDLPIRWLQELFPGNELIAASTGLAPDAIEFEVSDDQYTTFTAEAYGDDDALLASWELEIPSQLAPFVSAIEDSGMVRATTSGSTWYADGEFDATLMVPSDLDSFWTFWQDEVIPAVFAHIDELGGPHAASQPFYGELEAEVWISAPNERLGIRKENDSAAEALAEDIYFTTLDAIELYGRQQTGERCNAPGAIIPIVHVTPGEAPRARVTMRAAPVRRDLPRPDVRVTTLRLSGDELVMEIEATVDGDVTQSATRLAELAARPSPDGPSIAATIQLATEPVSMRLPLPEVPSAQHAAPSVEPPMDVNIHGEAIIDLAAQLARFPEVTAWVEERSYQGRPIVALSLAAPVPGRLASPTKAAIFKPTHLIVARHHANEISSTNAAFRLAWLCANDPEWRRYLDRVNILILPYENPDGAALHARLASFPEARTWKHHPARYNALGYEFGEAHFDPDTRFGEARARPALWRRWPADVVADNHGVPSHEWIQPFAGFGSPPRFNVSYWIVQALLYGIVRYVDDAGYPEHQAAVFALRDAVSAKIRVTDIGDWNRVYGESYRFWGQSRLPERFPGEFHDDMLWHISSGPVDPTGRGFAARYPRTTVLSWVSEVNDETAEGEHLDRVARAHLLANQATLDLLYAAAPPIRRWRIDEGDRQTLQIGRQRPLKLTAEESGT